MRQWEEERIKQKNKSLKWNKKNTFCEFIHLQFLNKDNRKKGGENLHFAALRWFSTDTGHQKINRKIPPRAPFCILHILSQTIRTPKNWDRKQNNVSWILTFSEGKVNHASKWSCKRGTTLRMILLSWFNGLKIHQYQDKKFDK